MFYRGQKVVYVGGIPKGIIGWLCFWRYSPDSDEPVRNKIYEIAYITVDDTLELVGMRSPGNKYWCPGYLKECFRPVAERKTDIGFAHEILRKVKDPTKATERA